jgi:peroxin-5
VQQNPSDHEAWYALGLKQQENEREDQAIRALAKVIDLDPDYRPAYLALAVSYTNEATHEKARVMLGKWIDMANVDSMSESEGSADLQGHQGLVDRLIDLARRSPEEVDPDVQIALGVLFNSSEVSLTSLCTGIVLTSRNTPKQRTVSLPPYLSGLM